MSVMLSLFPAVVLAVPLSFADHIEHLAVGKQVATSTCEIMGDPHVVTFSGHHCSALGSGVFQTYKKGGVQVQTFHCPMGGHRGQLGGTSVVAAAITDGTDTVEVVGCQIYHNGNKISKNTIDYTAGAISIHRQPNDVTEVVAGKVTLKSTKIANSILPTAYQMNLHITSERQAYAYKNDALCTLDGSGGGLKTPCPKSQIVFKTSTLNSLKGTCDVAYMESFMSQEDFSDTASSTSDEEPVSASRVGAMSLPACGE